MQSDQEGGGRRVSMGWPAGRQADAETHLGCGFSSEEARGAASSRLTPPIAQMFSAVLSEFLAGPPADRRPGLPRCCSRQDR